MGYLELFFQHLGTMWREQALQVLASRGVDVQLPLHAGLPLWATPQEGRPLCKSENAHWAKNNNNNKLLLNVPLLERPITRDKRPTATLLWCFLLHNGESSELSGLECDHREAGSGRLWKSNTIWPAWYPCLKPRLPKRTKKSNTDNIR